MKGLADEKWTGSSESIQYKPGKGVFLALLGASAFIVVLIAFIFWYVPAIGLGNIHPLLPYITGGALIILSVFVLGGASAIILTAARKKPVFYSKSFRWLLIKFFLPIMIMVGGILRVPRIKIEQTFIELNNQLVLAMKRKIRPEKLLILMPHCIQYDNCKIKVTRNVKNCVGCGKCEIGELVSLMQEFNISLFISTGGTVARRKVYEERPHAVIAVACERDLTSGLQDAYPLPVYAIVNKRPRGYCMETGVAIGEVRQAIIDLVAV